PTKRSSRESLAMDKRLMLLSASLTFSSSPLWWYLLSVSPVQRLTIVLIFSRYSATGRGLLSGSSSVNTDSSSARLAKILFKPSIRTMRRLVAAGGALRGSGSPLNLFGGWRALNAETVASSSPSLCFITSHHTSKNSLISDGDVSLAMYSTKCSSWLRHTSWGSAISHQKPIADPQCA
uniref:Uncharacterized protein n=1 Tax=Melopsittacus undulatus TaxID=13146 RepID=A0A8C6N769_MELUD